MTKNTFDPQWPGPVGVDVSKHQGEIDWPAFARAGVSFAWIKATEGVNYTDPWLERNVKGAQDAGLLVGLYHFARPSSRHPRGVLADASAEACDFAAEHERLFGWSSCGVLPPAMDIEWGGAKGVDRFEATTWADRFLADVWGFTGLRPIVYSGPNFINGRLNEGARGGDLDLAEYPLWMARYGASERREDPARREPDRRQTRPSRELQSWPWLIWQHSGMWPRPDGRGRIDANRFRGSIEDLRAFAGIVDETGVSWLDKLQSAIVRWRVR